MTDLALNNWQSVQEEVVRRIHAKIWKQGDLIPNEVDLAKEFGCARATVNRALQSLADSGLLDRRRKAGTRVAVYPARKATLDIPVIRRDIADKGEEYGYVLISKERTLPPAAIALKMDLSSRAKILHLVCVHMAGGKPYVIEDRWINPVDVPAAEKADFTQLSPNEWLVANVPFSCGEIAFSARNADAADARLLQCAPGEALFVIDRATRKEGRAMTSVRLTFAPEYQMNTTI